MVLHNPLPSRYRDHTPCTKQWLDSLKAIETVSGLMFSLVFRPLTTGTLPRSAALGDNLLGLSPNDGPLVANLLATVYTNPEDDAKTSTAVLKLIDAIDPAAVEAYKDAR